MESPKMKLVKYDVLVDRRTNALDEVRAEIHSLVESVRDLTVDWESDEAIEGARDDARFRDFARIATLAHPDERGLEWAAEEMIETFGWKVDITRRDPEENP